MYLVSQLLDDMKILSGAVRGRRLKTPKGLMTRPLLSRVRKSLFDILGEAVTCGPFLDLYAGSGSVGLEALSRGAPSLTLVERERECVQIIKENLSRCGFQHKARVIQDDVVRVLSSLLGEEKFYIVFVGPPYFHGLQNVTLQVFDSTSHRPVLIIVQHSSQEQVRVDWKHLEHVRSCSYGDTHLTFFTGADEPAA